MKYKLLSGTHGRKEEGKRVRYFPGDVLELDRSERRKLGGRVVPYVKEDDSLDPTAPEAVQVEVDPTQPKEEEDGDNEDWGGITDIPAPDVVDLIKDSEDPDDVNTILSVELSGKSRKTVVAAAEERLAELGIDVHADTASDDDS